MSKNIYLDYYGRKEIQDIIVSSSKKKEVGVSFKGEGYGKRPCILQYPADVLAHVKKGVTSFHASEEIWANPMLLRPAMDKKSMDALRIGWDLVLDIDCKEFEYSKIATHHINQFLLKMGITAVSCKFSGNKGFHIAVPFESFPTTFNGKKITELFPEAPRKIGTLVLERIKQHVEKDIRALEGGDLEKIAKKVGLSVKELTKKEVNEFGDVAVTLDPEPLIGIDTILLASRHLYRMEYSFNEKSGLVSVPVELDDVLTFTKDQATPDKVVFDVKFLDRSIAVSGEAAILLREAYDENIIEIERSFIKAFIPEELIQDFKELGYEEFNETVGKEFFPPCILKILEGLSDGRKRGMFILTNFLFSVGWQEKEVLELLLVWDGKNPKPLGESAIRSHTIYHAQRPQKILPPNCSSRYYTELGVCHPDNLCPRVKNPVVYAIRKFKIGEHKKKKK